MLGVGAQGRARANTRVCREFEVKIIRLGEKKIKAGALENEYKTSGSRTRHTADSFKSESRTQGPMGVGVRGRAFLCPQGGGKRESKSVGSLSPREIRRLAEA